VIIKRSKEWITKQLLTIGSTAAGVVAGMSPYQSRAELYDAMVEAEAGRITEKDMNDDMRRGIITEPLHREILRDELGKRVHDHDQEQFIYHEDYPWAHALPDGWLYDMDNGDQIPVQLKCPRISSWHKIKLTGIHSYWLIGTQHTLAITGAPYEIFSVLNVETMRIIQFPVYRDNEMIAGLMQIEKQFYQLFEERLRPVDNEHIPMEVPAIEGEMITLETDEAKNVSDAYLAAKELREEAGTLMETAEKRIVDLMGQSRVIQLPRLRCYRSFNQGRSTLDKEAMKRDGIDVGKYEKQGASYTAFRAFPLRRYS
jgi:putative phage-type endonuclease